jgi:hypothetical protein
MKTDEACTIRCLRGRGMLLTVCVSITEFRCHIYWIIWLHLPNMAKVTLCFWRYSPTTQPNILQHWHCSLLTSHTQNLQEQVSFFYLCWSKLIHHRYGSTLTHLWIQAPAHTPPPPNATKLPNKWDGLGDGRETVEGGTWPHTAAHHAPCQLASDATAGE